MFSNLIKLKGILDSALVRGVKVFHRLSNRGFYSPNLIWLQPLLSAQYLTAEINSEFCGYGTIPWGARELVPLITLNYFCYGLLSLEYTFTLGLDLPFPLEMLLVKYMISGRTECLIKHYSILHYIVSKKLIS